MGTEERCRERSISVWCIKSGFGKDARGSGDGGSKVSIQTEGSFTTVTFKKKKKVLLHTLFDCVIFLHNRHSKNCVCVCV